MHIIHLLTQIYLDKDVAPQIYKSMLLYYLDYADIIFHIAYLKYSDIVPDRRCK